MGHATTRFLDAAAALGFQPEVRRFPDGTKTAGDAAAAIGCDVAQIVKSLIFLADDRPIIALTSGRHRVDLSKLAAVAGAAGVRRATPEEARAAAGFAVGGTPPFGHPARLRAFLDRELLRYDVVWAAAGTPDTVFPLAPERLGTLAGALTADFAETPPRR